MDIFSPEYAAGLDLTDPLKDFINEFYLLEGTIYMDGNSLGLLSKRAEKTLMDTFSDWKESGIDGWMRGREPWFALSEKIGGMMAPLVGAAPDEVVCAGSTTVNLHQLASTFYEPSGKRTKILADELNFPSDIYALQSLLALKGYNPDTHLVRVESRDGRFLREEDIITAMTDEIALIVLPSVLYRSGQVLDMELLTREANKRGIPIGFDACHSIGAVPHRFTSWGVDFAFWCTYKHLNGGPGSTGGLYVNKKHHGRRPGLAGWFGSQKEKQFDMEHTFTPAVGAGAYQIGTPHVLSSAPLLGSLEIFAQAGIEKVREKSLQLTQYLISLAGQELGAWNFTIGSPLDEDKRGAHVSLEHKEAARICKALKNRGIIPDFRAPNIIRLAPAALYSTFEDVRQTIAVLKSVMEGRLYEQYPLGREVVA
ncbi:kynureninase [Peribacillus sp. SCS-37]|uniref:kynureninase n=1 Tax=Paraperibacillus esterisolvens TaxID=3115296 RepID=UPI0039061741